MSKLEKQYNVCWSKPVSDTRRLEVVPCGLVQHQYGGVLDEGPGYGDSLFLSPRDRNPSLTKDGIVPLRKRPDKAISISHRGSLNHLIQ